MMAIVGCATIVSVAGLRAVFLSWNFLWPAVAGATIAVLIGWAGHRYSLLVGESIALSILAYVLVGILVAGGGPTPSAIHNFFSGVVGSWSDIISATQPIDLTGKLRVVPFTLTWMGGTLGCELVRWSRTPSLPATGPLLSLALAVLLSAEDRTVALLQGTVLATATLVIGIIEQRQLRRDRQVNQVESEPRPSRRRVGRVVAMLAMVAVAAPFVGPRLPLANAKTRFELRNQTTPPWDPLSVPSPLVELKASLAEARRDEVVFTVKANEPIERWQVAVLGDYDGTVWTVGSGASSAASEFRPVDTRLPKPTDDVHRRPAVTATVTAIDLRGPWLPTPGPVATLQLRTGDSNGSVRANLLTGTMAIPGGVPANLSYDVTAYITPAATDEELTKARIDVRSASDDELAGLPPPVKNLAADLLEGQDFDWTQVATVRDAFRNSGFYDSTGRVPPGHSYFRLAQFLSDPQRIVGYEEQYAAAAAVIMRTALLPSRVVVGYRIPADRWTDGIADVHAGDISAWVEVDVDDYGWMPIDVTPERTRTPNDQQQGKTFEDVAVPNPPPPPQLPPKIEVLNGDDNIEKATDTPDDNKSDEAAGQWWTASRVVLAIAGSLVLLVVGAACVVVFAKHRRRRRRQTAPRPSDRIAGAWLELADRCREARVPLADRATPLEAARALLGAEPATAAVRDDLFALVDTVDRAAYHAIAPEADRANGAWVYCDNVVDALHGNRSAGRRLVMRVDPRPLRFSDPVGAGRQP